MPDPLPVARQAGRSVGQKAEILLLTDGNATDLAGSALQLGIWLLLVLTAMSGLPLAALIAAEAAFEGRGEMEVEELPRGPEPTLIGHDLPAGTEPPSSS